MALGDTLVLLGVMGGAVGVAGALLTFLPQLSWGRDGEAGGYR